MSRVLVLDDERVRHDAFDDELGEHDVVHVKTASQAIYELTMGGFDVVFLDHDLGTQRTGLDVAAFVAALPEDLWPRLVVVHSMNPVGAQRIRAVLSRAGVPVLLAPFGEPVGHLV